MGTTSRDLKPYKLEKLIKERSSLSGANIENWTTIDTIQVAIYKKRTTITVEKVRKFITIYKGLTKYKNLHAGIYRLVGTGEVYEISDAFPGLWTNLELEKVNIE